MKKYFKPIIVTLAIILVCGGLLAILSDVLKVSSEERIQRAINKIYTEESVSLSDDVDVNSVDMSEFDDVGKVKACYKLDNGDYLVLATGKKGYSNGTVTLYVAINGEGLVKNVVEDSYTGQTLMSKLGGLYERFVGKDYSENQDGVKEVVNGATGSSTAASNAVYVALQFAKKLGK